MFHKFFGHSIVLQYTGWKLFLYRARDRKSKRRHDCGKRAIRITGISWSMLATLLLELIFFYRKSTMPTTDSYAYLNIHSLIALVLVTFWEFKSNSYMGSGKAESFGLLICLFMPRRPGGKFKSIIETFPPGNLVYRSAFHCMKILL